MRSGLGTLHCIIAAARDIPVLPRALAHHPPPLLFTPALHTSELAQTRLSAPRSLSPGLPGCQQK
eukprot:2619727-Prymnesium_polylepis.1